MNKRRGGRPLTYQALYRKWRPQRFEEIVGQEAVSKTLSHAIAQGRPSHAYLFCGPRGTGKTSAAKIFSKAINCPHSTAGEPCNQCVICKAITEGSLSDVIEIDAASNNGVEEIRDIRDKVRYTPTEALYKVYIIDEVHMLSTGAFNALLKTLEEPPQNVIFILATTEAHKIPATVISRTQRFDFKRLSKSALVGRMAYILDQEKISYEEEALTIIAQEANGGMRDALSLLDQVLSFSQGQLTVELTRQVTGVLSDEMKITYVEALANGEVDRSLGLLREILASGREASRFIEEMLVFIRDLLLAQQLSHTGESELLRHYPEAFHQCAQAISGDNLYQMMQVFNDVKQDLRYTLQPDIYLEVATIKLGQGLQLSSSSSSQEWEQLQEEVVQLKQMVHSLQASLQATGEERREETHPVQEKATGTNKLSTGKTFEPDYALIYQTLSQATKMNRNRILSVWPEVISALPTVQQALLHQTEPVAASPDAFVVTFDYAIFCQRVHEDKSLLQEVSRLIQQFLGRPGWLLVVTKEQWQEIRQTYVSALKEGRQEELVGVVKTETPPKEESEELPESVEDTVSQSLIDLFGEDQVTIMDD